MRIPIGTLCIVLWSIRNPETVGRMVEVVEVLPPRTKHPAGHIYDNGYRVTCRCRHNHRVDWIEHSQLLPITSDADILDMEKDRELVTCSH